MNTLTNETQNITDKEFKINTIEEAIEAIRNGEIIIVVDDEDRENEGDFICAADTVTPEHINFMSKYGRGLICTPITSSIAEKLELKMMVSSNTALHETAFTVSIDLIGQGCTTGISASDRSKGIKAMLDPDTSASDFARPGHIFPLIATDGGVLRRTGHTEATIDLARLAGFKPAGVLVEILNDDGTMARLPQLVKIAEKHNLKLIAIKDLVAYRMETERLIKCVHESTIQSKYGEFNVRAYKQTTTDDIHLAIFKGDFKENQTTPVRVHSSTETGSILGLLFDNGLMRLDNALKYIAEKGHGVLLNMRHGEKGDEVLNKLKALDNDPTNDPRHNPEQRDFGVGAQILRDLGISKIALISNSEKRRVGLKGYGLEIVDQIKI